ncbi:predicted chemotaxis protein histidine kinase [gamma proteobacterium HdN1]|nr:predicted chemotaxis protein histidine kinase [gamma proteobacterium HdN1]
MSLDDAFQAFVIESSELLQDMEDHLLAFSSATSPEESINCIFRAAHTIKETAGLFGIHGVVGFTHVVESVLQRVREGSLPMTDALISLILECKDYISRQIGAIQDDVVIMDDGMIATEKGLFDQLCRYMKPGDDTSGVCCSIETEASAGAEESQPAGAQPAEKVRDAALGNPTIEAKDDAQMENENWHISVQFSEDVLRQGMDPAAFLRYLNTIGKIQHIVTHFERIPKADEMDPESCYIGYEINFKTEADKSTIEGVFEFVRDDCQLRIIPPHARASDFITAIQQVESAGHLKLGEILVQCGSLTSAELKRLLGLQKKLNEGGEKARLGELVVQDQSAHPEVVQAALHRQEQNKHTQVKTNQTLRVDAVKLDHLINLVGELVIAGAGIESGAKELGNSRLLEASLTMARLIEEVRDSSLRLRMVQIGETFNRFQRVVRDISKDLGKQIELEINGRETELDKSVIEKIGDPLTHLVRNAMDHGIEPPEVRRERGKSEIGMVGLNAYHESGSIVIEVSDDGGGLNQKRIFEKAVEKGLVAADAVLTPQQIYQMIFEAGFSTAATVSNISGRGVGMDVVRRNIESLRGSIEIDSEEGIGTKIKVRLPLTLAIIDGFMIGVDESCYVLPLDVVEQCRELSELEQAQCRKNNYINLDGAVLPLIRLRDFFEHHGPAPKRENIVVVKHGARKTGFVVDHLLGELQTVIKPMGPIFGRMRGISGSTILGSGDVALILDTASLVERAVVKESSVVTSRRLACP